ncbi:DoxX family protein [Candidatus Pacearchaeota archaeon]|nr:DoxX family protein [Candidatus Pacearchaeota archaeon]
MKEKTIRIWYWIITILFALFMLYSGIAELVGTESGNALIIGLGYPLYINTILGIAKVLGVIAIVQTKWKTIKEWAYAGFAFDIIGAMASFALAGFGIIPVLTTLPFLLVMFISYGLWKKVDSLR